MKKLTALLVLGSIGTFASQGLAASNDSMATGEPDTLFALTDHVAEGTSEITSIRFLPDGRMLIGEKRGALKIRENDGTIRMLYTFAVTTNSEQGLVGLAVQPDFATSRRIVVYWTRANSVGGTTENRINVSSFQLKADDTIDFASERILVKDITAPANHDGGGLSFGPDGLLYVGVGDNGCNESIPRNRLHQNLRGTSFNTATGKVLRVAVDGSIPPSNPFVGATGAISGVPLPSGLCEVRAGTTMPTVNEPVRKEIYAMGFRNPFRIFVDPKTSFIWVGDVGETSFEEISLVKAPGQHFGWPFIEGEVSGDAGPHGPTKCTELTPNPGNCVEPVHAYGHLPGNVNGSVTGGVIVDSCKFPKAWRGTYFFADYLSREIYSMTTLPNRDGLVAGSRKVFANLGGTPGQGPTEIVEGPDGGLYIALYAAPATVSRVLRIFPKVPASDTDCNPSKPTDAGPSPSDGGGGGGGDGGGGGGGGGGGAASDAGVGPSATSDDASSGCGCETVGARAGSAALSLGAFGVLALVVARRRRRL